MAVASDSIGNDATWQRWHDELLMASKAKGYRQWQERARKIIKRYRDDRGDGDGASDGMVSETQMSSKFNILWSNVQTLMPALFAKTPKPVVERRYLDSDEVGRTASVILERALCYELDEGQYQASLRRAVLDRLLPGRGVIWVRYEPKFSDMETASEDDGGADDTAGGDEVLTEDNQQVASESTAVDYVDWQDFQTSPARTWEEVWWVSKRVYMTRKEMTARFGAKKADEVPLDWAPNKDLKTMAGVSPDTGNNEGQKRAKVIEIWCKPERKVYWIAESWGSQILDEKDDPLQLEGFWPVPKPLFASTTNDTLVPVPDFYEYQDQAGELDDLTNRISWLTKSIKSAGVYDASIPELQRMFEEGFENKLVPADNMAEFTQKAGPTGMGHMWLLPIKEQAEVLIRLYEAREQVKQSLYEITGISDIVRGAQSSGSRTATEQRIKGQFASMRLNDMQAEVARFARDTLRIMGEIIAEHFDPMTLFLVSGFEQYAKDQWPAESFKPAPQGGQQPMMGHNGGPPMEPQGAPQQPATPQTPPPVAGPVVPPPIVIPPEVQAQQKAAQMFQAAVALLKNDKLRGFRIDIETDSLIEPDQQAMQQSRTELLGAIAQFLPQALQAGMAMPEMKPLLARLMMFFLRGFKASRDIESAFEQFVDDLTKDAANPAPKPPSPEQMKAQAEQIKQQGENQRMQAQAVMDKQNNDATMAQQQQKSQLELAMLQADFQFNQQKQALELQMMQADLDNKRQTAMIDAAVTTHKANTQMEIAEHKAAQVKANGAAQ